MRYQQPSVLLNANTSIILYKDNDDPRIMKIKPRHSTLRNVMSSSGDGLSTFSARMHGIIKAKNVAPMRHKNP